MTDFRQLCLRMADELDHYRQLLTDDRCAVHLLAAEARAALAAFTPPADGEAEELATATENVNEYQGVKFLADLMRGASLYDGADFCGCTWEDLVRLLVTCPHPREILQGILCLTDLPANKLLREASPQPVPVAEPVAWLWEYIGSDPYPRRHSPVARSINEMDPSNPPYPDTWAPIAPLYEARWATPTPTEPTTTETDD